MSNCLPRMKMVTDLPEHAGKLSITRGIEKESLRVTPEGKLAESTHPTALGSALTHPHITTDYSEALLELITAPASDIQQTLQQLNELHAYTCQNIGNENLWATSMPCTLESHKEIPVAQYGCSNSGKMKTAYRTGLGHRYGRPMQTIAGVHYNFSLPDSFWQCLLEKENSPLSLQDFKTQGYFGLIRNFRRYFWLLLYLFGASPCVCNSFVRHKEHHLLAFNGDDNSLYSPFATSLRMGDMGYQSDAQQSLIITYNSLNSYIETLCDAITRTYPKYAATGITSADGSYLQLNDSLLQIENEFYSVIRPKRTTQRGETALAALADGGVEYVEVRCLDVNPYDPAGINEQQIHFLDTFLLFCLLANSPQSNHQEHHDMQINQKRMVYYGRAPGLSLLDQGKERAMRDWGRQIMSELEAVAQWLDQDTGANNYQQNLQRERQKLTNPLLTPSARILADMEKRNITFQRFAIEQSLKHKQYFSHYALKGKNAWLQSLAKASFIQQQKLEDDDLVPFDDYLANYYAQYQCRSSACFVQSHSQ